MRSVGERGGGARPVPADSSPGLKVAPNVSAGEGSTPQTHTGPSPCQTPGASPGDRRPSHPLRVNCGGRATPVVGCPPSSRSPDPVSYKALRRLHYADGAHGVIGYWSSHCTPRTILLLGGHGLRPSVPGAPSPGGGGARGHRSRSAPGPASGGSSAEARVALLRTPSPRTPRRFQDWPPRQATSRDGESVHNDNKKRERTRQRGQEEAHRVRINY